MITAAGASLPRHNIHYAPVAAADVELSAPSLPTTAPAISATTPPASEVSIELTVTNDKTQEVAKLLTQDVPKSDHSAPAPQVTVMTNGYKIVVSATAIALLAQVLINRFAGGNSIDESEESAGVTFFTTMFLSHFCNKSLKGLWRETDSAWTQLKVLAASVGAAGSLEALSSLIPGASNTAAFGQTTAITLASASNYFVAMIAAKILGQTTAVKGPRPKGQPDHFTLRKCVNAALIAAASIASAVTYRVLDKDSSLNAVIATISAEMKSRCYKAGRDAESVPEEFSKDMTVAKAARELTTPAKRRTILGFSALSTLMDAFIGCVISKGYSVYQPQRYISPTTVSGLFSSARLLTKENLNAEKPPKDFSKKKKNKKAAEPAAGEAAPQIQVEVPPITAAPAAASYQPSRLRRIGMYASAVLTPVLATAVNCANAATVKASTLVFGTRLTQHNVNSVVYKDIYGRAKGTIQQLAVAASPTILGVSVDFVAKAALPTLVGGWPMTLIGLAMSGNFVGTTLSNYCFRGDIDSDE